jgi:hypothetical protein
MHLKDFEPDHNDIDKTIYNLFVPARNQTQKVSHYSLNQQPESQQEDNNSDSDEEVDKFGVTKRHFDMDIQVNRWKHVIENGPSELKGTTIIYDRQFGVGSIETIQSQRSMSRPGSNKSDDPAQRLL